MLCIKMTFFNKQIETLYHVGVSTYKTVKISMYKIEKMWELFKISCVIMWHGSAKLIDQNQALSNL